MGWPRAHHELPASRCFEPIGQAPADPDPDPELRARLGPNDHRLEPLSPRERGEGRAKRLLRTSQSIPSPSPVFCRLRRRATAFGQPCGLPHLAAVIGWALAHHELHACLVPAPSLRCFVTWSLEAKSKSFRSVLPRSQSMAIHGHSRVRPARVPFLCVAKEKEPKERPPLVRALRASVREGFA